MNPVHLAKTLAISLLVFLAPTSRADISANHFASVLLNGNKIGHVQYTTFHDSDGILQELRTRSSLSILGSEVYHHSMHIQEFWQDGEIKLLWGTANEDGTSYQVDLKREASGYQGTLNAQPIELPANSFPTAVWHYAITQQTLLFSIPELKLLNVKVEKSEDSVKIGKVSIEAEKFEFYGDWNAIIWFDHEKQFLKWQYKIKGRTVIVVLDP